ncbi:MAG: acetylglutamate kinase [Deltaproteobacteria bacterium]|nr:MAG: acetylglutamate kinase [Deltaproteobacteria bacterium]
MSAHAEEPPSPAAARRTLVVKFGGEVVADGARLGAVLDDVARLVRDGHRILLCHGGGPQAGRLQRALGLEPHKVAGRRVTDPATLEVVVRVLAGEVSVAVVSAALARGISAVGVSGVSGPTVVADRRPPIRVPGHDEPVDYGLVGRVRRVETRLVEHLWSGGYVPVLNPLGVEVPAPEGAHACPVYNINADTVACAVAGALGADDLFLMSDVPGILRDVDDPASRIATMDRAQVEAAIADGTIAGGMIPKVQGALRALDAGVGRVHVCGAGGGVLADEMASPGSRGTTLVAGGAAS